MIEFNTRKHILQKLYFVVSYVLFSYGNKSQQESKPTINLIMFDVNPVCPGKRSRAFQFTLKRSDLQVSLPFGERKEECIMTCRHAKTTNVFVVFLLLIAASPLKYDHEGTCVRPHIFYWPGLELPAHFIGWNIRIFGCFPSSVIG